MVNSWSADRRSSEDQKTDPVTASVEAKKASGRHAAHGPNPEDGVSSSNKQQGSRVTRRTKMRLKSQTEIPGWRRKRCLDWEIRKQRITTAKPRPPLAAADSQKRKSVEKKS
jgi:hypothetical protein